MSQDNSSIAIIGMACRFPGASSVEAFWSNLQAGQESITFFSEDELLAAGVPRKLIENPAYVPAAPTLDDIDKFDASFFDYSPREASVLDPQQRLLLETAWHTFEDAGYNSENISAPVAVFAGSGGSVSSYFVDHLRQGSDLFGSTGSMVHMGNDKDFVATRVSYKLNLTGPSLTVQTACSTSMVAVHLACQSLLNGECELALAGAAVVRSPHKEGYLARQGDILSSDGHCRPFDAKADGTIFGSGIGAVLLKPLDRAIADGDNIYATIKATAINNDGRDKISYTASSVDGQARAMVEALTLAGVHPDQVGMVECHGTGTIVGDPLEIQALSIAFKHLGVQGREYCPVGSVKANIGHLEQAAGIASLIKTALCLKHKTLLPLINFKRANRKIRFRRSPFYVNTRRQAWEVDDGATRVACVNSLGLGGSNAFLVLEEAPPRPKPSVRNTPSQQILTLSAKDKTALRQQIDAIRPILADCTTPDFANICHTLNAGRADFAYRLTLNASTGQEAADALAKMHQDGTTIESLTAVNRNRPIIFLFPGQGAQYRGMARQLYAAHPLFRATIDYCSDLLKDQLDVSLCDLLLNETDDTKLRQTMYAQPTLFAVGVALDRLWRSWGVTPAAVIGHSVGEYAAAVSAGVMSLEDGLTLIAARGRLMQSLPSGGAMASVLAQQATVDALIAELSADALEIAAINASNAIVVSGTESAVDRFVSMCAQRDITSRKLAVSHAFHSQQLDPILDQFEAIAAQINYQRPRVGLLSNVSGQIVYGAPDARYWRKHARQPVRFAACVHAAQEFAGTSYLELGPGTTLLRMARANKPTGDNLMWLPSLERAADEWQTMLTTLGALYRTGASVDWDSFGRPFGRQKVSLPRYPFQGKRHWHQSKPSARRMHIDAGNKPHPLLGVVAASNAEKRVYRKRYDLSTFGYLDHHRVYGMPVLPFAAGLEALVAAGAAHTDGMVSAENVTYHNALLVENRAVEITLMAQSADRFAFELSSQAEGDSTARQMHINGTVQRGAAGISAEKFDPQRTTAALLQIDPTVFYDRADALGLNYGPLFRGMIKSLWQGDGETVSQLCLHDDLNPAPYMIHPALLDGCLHVFPALISHYGDLSDGLRFYTPGYLPVSLSRFALKQAVRGDVWVHAKRREESAEQQRLVVDFTLYDAAGEALGQLVGFEFRRISKANLRPVATLPHGYQLVWDDVAPISAHTAVEAVAANVQRWIVVADRVGVADALAQQVTALGSHVQIIRPDQFKPEDDRAGAWRNALRQTLASFDAPCDKIISLAALDVASFDTLTADNLRALEKDLTGDALYLTQAIVAEEQLDAKLYLVTRNACPVGFETEPAANPLHTALWGFGRTLALETPRLWGGLIDLPHLPSALPRRDAIALLIELTADGPEDQLAVRPEGRFTPRLTRVDIGHERPSVPLTQPNSSYLITGGTGGLGLKVARWLVETHSADHLVLMSRRTPQEAAAAEIAALEQAGCCITLVQGDVGNSADVSRIFAQMRQTLPALRGIVHCAGMLADGVIGNIDWAQFASVTRPKTLGAWLLHEQSRELPLDFFLLFSSVLGIMGSAGQSNYAAGNAFLDGLAAARQQQGLPATVINWGPWADIGMAIVSGERGEQIWNRRGTEYIPPALGIDYLDTIMRLGLKQVAVTINDWARYSQQFDVTPPMYVKLQRRALAGGSADAIADQGPALASLPPAERRAALLELVSSEVASVLGAKAGQIGVDDKLDKWGLDSLMTIELINSFHTTLPVSIPRTVMVQQPTIHSLVDAAMLEFDDIHSADDSLQNAPDGPSREGDWLLIHEPRPQAKLKLLCFGFAGGGPGIFSKWSENLPDLIEVAAVHLPGRGGRLGEAAPTRVAETVDRLVESIEPYLDRPFALFGHCLGAIQMYETAQVLSSRHNKQAMHLFASGSAAPDRYTIPAHYESPDAQLLDLLKLVDFAATEGLVQDADLRAIAFPTLRADLEAAAHYAVEFEQAREPLPVPITAFGGWEDMYAAPHGVDAWRNFTSGPFDIMMRPGNHYFLETERAAILEVITDRLSDAGPKPKQHAPDVDALWSQQTSPPPSSAAIKHTDPCHDTTNWLRCLNSAEKSTKPALVCFPPAWTSGLALEKWLPQLEDSFDVWEICYPGHGRLAHQAPLASLSELATGIENQLDTIGDNSIFYGHCMGALIAFEVAKRLEQQSKTTPTHLFLSGAASPDTFVYPWAHLQPNDKLRELMQTIGYPDMDALNGAAAPSLFAMLRADFAAQAGYRYQPAAQLLKMPITAVIGRKDHWTSPFSIQRWQEQTSADFDQITHGGTHFDLDRWMPDVIVAIKEKGYRQ